MLKQRLAKNNGFTLIELMVVVALIAIVMGSVVLSVGDGGKLDRLEIETKRMSALIKLLGEEAILKNKEFAVVIDETEYDFQELDKNNKWKSLEGDAVFHKRKITDNSIIEMILEDFDVDFEAQKEKEDVKIFLLSSGEMSPFEIKIKDVETEAYFMITGSMVGALKIEGPFQPNQD
ncbi:MAG: type II secretion system minor pseudopilin GspH [Thiohalomonadales bacterium]